MKQTILFLVLAFSAVALADKVVTSLSNRATIDQAFLTNRYDGGYDMVACGHTLQSDGGPTSVECYRCTASLPLAGSDVLACYKAGEGL